MKSTPTVFLMLALIGLAETGLAQTAASPLAGKSGPRYYARDSLTRSGYTLIFISKDSAFAPVTKQKMIDAFFTVYPKEAKRFNLNTLKKLVVV